MKLGDASEKPFLRNSPNGYTIITEPAQGNVSVRIVPGLAIGAPAVLGGTEKSRIPITS